jgi:hypothetical protein
VDKHDAESQVARFLSSGAARPSIGRIKADYKGLSCCGKAEAYMDIIRYNLDINSR